MVAEVKLSRSLEKRVGFPTTLIGFFWVIGLWYLICTGLCISLPGLDAGVVHIHHCEGERRVMCGADFRSTWVWWGW